jgi:flagellar basal body rod protein FlgC
VECLGNTDFIGTVQKIQMDLISRAIENVDAGAKSRESPFRIQSARLCTTAA